MTHVCTEPRIRTILVSNDILGVGHCSDIHIIEREEVVSH